MKKIIIILIIIIAGNFTTTEAHSIDEIITSVRNNNLELQAIESRAKATSSEIKSTNNLEATSVDFEYLFGDKSIGNKWEIGVSQGFDWPGLYYSRNKANKSQISALQYLSAMQSLELLSATQNICLQIIYTNKQIKLQQQIEDDMQQLYNLYNKGFEYGEISILDVNKIKIELINVRQQKNDLELKNKALTDKLNALNGESAIGVEQLKRLREYPQYELLPMSEYLKILPDIDPEYKYYVMMNEANAHSISVAKRQWFPSISVGYKYVNELGEKFNGITAGMALPLFSNNNKVVSAKAQSIADSFEHQNMIIAKETNVKNRYNTLESLTTQIKGYNDALNNGENLRVLKKALEGGQITLLQYLTELNYFIEAESNLIKLQFDYTSILAELNKYKLLQY